MVSESVLSTMRYSDRSVWDYAGEQSLKGIPYPVRVYRSTTGMEPSGSSQAEASRELPAASTTEAITPWLGIWIARVHYAWGDAYDERFEFKRHAGELTGSASFLRYPRAIIQLRLDGDNLHFTTHSIESVGTSFKQLTHAYAVELRGQPPDDVLAFRLSSSGGHSSNPPIEFEARRVPAAASAPASS